MFPLPQYLAGNDAPFQELPDRHLFFPLDLNFPQKNEAIGRNDRKAPVILRKNSARLMMRGDFFCSSMIQFDLFTLKKGEGRWNRGQPSYKVYNFPGITVPFYPRTLFFDSRSKGR